MPASTTMDMPQQREENKRAYIYTCLAATVPLHEDPFHIQPFTNIKEELKRQAIPIKDQTFKDITTQTQATNPTPPIK